MVIATRSHQRSRAPGGLRLNLLGGFAMIAAGERCDIPEGCKRLLVYLALHELPQSRMVVATSLWPDRTDERACANLRSSIWRMPAPLGEPVVSCVGSNLQLSEHLDVDVKLAEAAGWALIDDPQSVLDQVDPMVFRLELLPGWYDDWIIFERERVAQLQLHFLEALTYALLERGRLAQALDVALRLVGADPLREASQRALLSVYRSERNLGQVQRQFAAYRELTRRTFGCEPSCALAELASIDP